MTFESAMRILASKKNMPTELGTDDLRAMSRQVRQFSLYSARTTDAHYLEALRANLQDFINGKINEVKARELLHGFQTKSGMDVNIHGPITDITSDARVRLVLETNASMVENWAYMSAGVSRDRMNQFPAWELVRVIPKMVPRDDWDDRWEAAGGELTDDGRMVALKTDEVWKNLGDSRLFKDGTDSDAPPYAYGSGMGIRAIDRAECIDLGLIDDDYDAQGMDAPNLGGDWLSEGPGAVLGNVLSAGVAIHEALSAIKEVI